jgi:hypothetical protein
MASVLVTDSGVEGSNPAVVRTAAVWFVAFALISGVLLATGRRDYPDLHTVLDTGMSLLSGVLAALLWDMGRRAGRPFPTWLSIGFAVTSALELVHVLVTVEWTGSFAVIAASAGVLRPSTWPPAAHALPIATAGSLWLLRRNKHDVVGFGVGMVAVAALLLLIYRWLPTYTRRRSSASRGPP